MTDNIMLSVGAFTRMIAQIIGYTITTPDPIVTLPPFDPSTATIPTLRHLLDTGRASSAFLVEVYLDQVLRHPADAFTFDQGHLMAQARICDDTRAKWNVVGPLGGIPVLVAVKAGTHELMKPDRKGIEEGVEKSFLAGLVARKAATSKLMEPDRNGTEGVERPFLAGLVARKAATHDLMEPDRKRTEGVERPLMEGRGLVLGFLDENVLREAVKWERLEGGTVIETCVVEGLAVVVRDVVERDASSCGT